MALYLYATWAMSMFKGRIDGSLVRIEMNRGEAAVKARIEESQKGSLPRLEEALP
jgi:hypothetical protein